MSDPDVICYLFPVKLAGDNNPLRSTFDQEENAGRLLGLTDGVRKEISWWPSEEAFRDEPCLKFTFSNPPKTRKGLVAGRCPDADLVLPNVDCVSRYHFALTFDHNNRLIVRDLNSKLGTQVIHDGEDPKYDKPRIDFDWDTHSPGCFRLDEPVIKITDSLQLKLLVPRHNIRSKDYLDKVARFRLGTASCEGLFDDMRPTEIDTMGLDRKSILWKGSLGGGMFGEVHRVLNLETKEEYALKKPWEDKKYDLNTWRKEAKIMKNISHESIVKLKYAMFDEKPELYFEYVPAGSLLDYLPVTTSFHNQSIAVQVLSGVEYLHNLEVPTTHRDIKPENVLVQHWRSDSVCIKLADFGLSKQSDYLQTRCGTAIYAAPEILSGRYTPLVDIWSVGVLLVRLECGRLPGYRQGISPLAWAIALLSFVQEYLQGKASRLLSFVLQDMFVIQAEGRLSASKCHAKALEIFEEEMDGSANGSAVSSMELSETGEKWDEGGASSTEYANASPVGRKRRPDQEDNETRKRIKVW